MGFLRNIVLFALAMWVLYRFYDTRDVVYLFVCGIAHGWIWFYEISDKLDDLKKPQKPNLN